MPKNTKSKPSILDDNDDSLVFQSDNMIVAPPGWLEKELAKWRAEGNPTGKKSATSVGPPLPKRH